jgi:hypothetical protein
VKRLATALLLAASSCGGRSAVDLSQIIGVWSGTFVLTVGGATETVQGQTDIVDVGGNQVTVGNICADGSGPKGTVTNDMTFTLQPSTCGPAASNICASEVIAVDSGLGIVSAGTLSLNAMGTASGCGTSLPVTITFNGTRS